MPIHAYYTQQSPITSPGRFAYLFDELPDDLPELCRIVRGLVRHYADDEGPKNIVPVERFREMDMRYVETILAKIMDYNASPLSHSRESAERIVGVCRDNSILICSILRHKHIPARLRAGFVNYVIPGLYLDGIFLEYWDTKQHKWCLVDTRTRQEYLDQFHYYFNLYDVPRDRFLLAADAWKFCRENKIPANLFGFKNYRGLHQVRNRLMQDLAFLNKTEVLIWDIWGLMCLGDNPWVVAAEHLPVLDDLSQLIREHSYDLIKLQDCYQNSADLRVPANVSVCNPFFEMRDVVL